MPNAKLLAFFFKLSNEFNQLIVVELSVTDRVKELSNAIGSIRLSIRLFVRPFVSILTYEPSDL